jgi:dinuclear metal center YbgI/SA1388 family protein
MEKLDRIVEFLDSYLDIASFKDTSYNGLQIEGKPEVKKILFAVDSGSLTFKYAADRGADMVVVHHGNFWQGTNPSLAGWNLRRLEPLLTNRISLYACHLPLDAHPVVGNNAQLLKILGAKISEPIFVHEGKNISWTGKFRKPVPLKAIAGKLEKRLCTRIRILPFGPDDVKTMALCSGGAGYAGFAEALNKKVDLYLTGDGIDVFHTARDAGINVIFAGHHATETVGVQALMKVVAERFSVKTIFADIKTGL